MIIVAESGFAVLYLLILPTNALFGFFIATLQPSDLRSVSFACLINVRLLSLNRHLNPSEVYCDVVHFALASVPLLFQVEL